MALTAAFALDTTYTFVLGGASIGTRGDGATCQILLRHPDHASNALTLISPDGVTNTVGAFKSPGQDFTGTLLREAYELAANVIVSDPELFAAVAFRVGAGGGCDEVDTFEDLFPL